MPAQQQDNLSQFLPDWMKGQGVEITGIDLLLKVHVPLTSEGGKSVRERAGRRVLAPPPINLLARGRPPGLRKQVPMSRNLPATNFDYATDYARYLISQGHEDETIRHRVSEDKDTVIPLFHLRKMRDELGVPRDTTYVPKEHPHMRRGSGKRPINKPKDKKIPCPVCQESIRASNMSTHIEARHKSDVDKALANRPQVATAGSVLQTENRVQPRMTKRVPR